MSTSTHPSFLPDHLQRKVLITSCVSPQEETYKRAQKEAQRNLDITRTFLKAIFGIDLTELSITAEILPDTPNAFASWEEKKVSLGIAHFNGDDGTPACFTSLDIVAHEVAHLFLRFLGIHLEYKKQPGAIEENVCDLFSIMVREWALKEASNYYTGEEREWSIGDRIVQDLLRCDKENCYLDKMVLRCFIEPGSAYKDHPYFGDDPQRLRYQNVPEDQDHSGVHLNSAILNHIFYKWCTECRISPIEVGKIWLHTLREMRQPNILQALIKHDIVKIRAIDPTTLMRTRLVQTLVRQNVVKESAQPLKPSELLQALVDHNIIGTNDRSSPEELLGILAGDGVIKASEQSPPEVLKALVTQQIVEINCNDNLLQKNVIAVNESCVVLDFLKFLKEQQVINRDNKSEFLEFLKSKNITQITPKDIPNVLQFFITPMLKENKVEQVLTLLQQLVTNGFITIKDAEPEFQFKRLAAKIGASPCIKTAQARAKVKEIFSEILSIAFSGDTSPKRRSGTLPPNIFEELKRESLADAFSKLQTDHEAKRRHSDTPPGKSPIRKKRRLFGF
jgi:hypothetical protein